MHLGMLKSKLKPQRKLGRGESKVYEAYIGVCYTLAVTLDTIAAAAPKSPLYFSMLLEFKEKENAMFQLKTTLGGERARKQKELTIKLSEYCRPGSLIFINNLVS